MSAMRAMRMGSDLFHACLRAGITARISPRRRRPLAPAHIPEACSTAPCDHKMVGLKRLASVGG